MKKASIFNIPINYDFCQTLYDIAVKKHSNDIANLTIFLPSRRSCRQLQKIFAKQHHASLMPRIKAIADINYEDFIFLFSDKSFCQQNQKDIENTIDQILNCKALKGIDELFYIARQVQKIKIFAVNNNFYQSLKIADNLRNIFAQIEREGIDIKDFDKIDDSDLSSHRQITVEFLKNFYFQIKNSLIKDKILLESSFSNLKISKLADFLDQEKLKKPLIIAGSTASSHVVKKLIKAAIKNSEAQIVLSGFWLESKIPQNHPQFFLNQLVNFLNILPKDIFNLENDKFLLTSKKRTDLVRQIFLNIEEIQQWNYPKEQNFINDLQNNFYKIEAKNIFDEAKIISKIAILESQKQQKIAIIVNDSQISNLINQQLRLKNINFNCSESISISNSSIVNFLFLIIDFCSSNFNSHSFLSIIKNPLSRYCNNQKLLETFELEILRSSRIDDKINGVKDKLEKHGDSSLIEFFNEFCSDIEIFLQNQNKGFSSHIKSLITALEKITNKSWLDLISSQEAGLEIFEFIENLKNEKDFFCEFSEFQSIFKYLVNQIYYFQKTNPDLPIHIISPIEARLLQFDVVIIAALNEGIFPKSISENWLGRKVRKDLGIDNDLKQSGQNAYDFCHYLAAKKVVISRHLTKDDKAIEASCLWLRFDLFCQKSLIKIDQYNLNTESTVCKQESEPVKNNQKKYTEFYFDINHLSITDCTKLIKNPYFIFAKKILGLNELKDIDYQPSFAEFGSFIHEALENYINKSNSDLLNDFLSQSKTIFNKYFLRREDKFLWWIKFPQIIKNFIKDNEDFSNCKNLLELDVETYILDQKILGRIDRIIIDKDNNLQIIDYKTGTIPTKKSVASGIESQLTLAALAAVETLSKSESLTLDLSQIKALKYWKISISEDKNIKLMVNHDEMIQTIECAKENLQKIINYFFIEKNKFITTNKDTIGCYWHLSRID